VSDHFNTHLCFLFLHFLENCDSTLWALWLYLPTNNFGSS
jgi:hypothetical protein